jgi:predicted RNA binding protein YcfA (HicA-like mRNA interferase family)
MNKLPVMSGKDICRILSKMDFAPIRQRGSHVFMQHPDGRGTVVPMHAHIGKGLLKRILNESEIDRKDFLNNI